MGEGSFLTVGEKKKKKRKKSKLEGGAKAKGRGSYLAARHPSLSAEQLDQPPGVK